VEMKPENLVNSLLERSLHATSSVEIKTESNLYSVHALKSLSDDTLGERLWTLNCSKILWREVGYGLRNVDRRLDGSLSGRLAMRMLQGT
jgi:hypothetical protein